VEKAPPPDFDVGPCPPEYLEAFGCAPDAGAPVDPNAKKKLAAIIAAGLIAAAALGWFAGGEIWRASGAAVESVKKNLSEAARQVGIGDPDQK